MMDSFLEIHLLPDPEFPPTILMSALFSKLHRGLVEHAGRNIGVSFPDVQDDKRSLGLRLRLHGTTLDLTRLMQIEWILGMRDHVDIGVIGPVPDHAGHRNVRRVQAKSSPERLRRRLIARRKLDSDTARQAIPDSAAQRLDLPHVVMTSRTTGQRFRLFIEHRPIQHEAASGVFSAYGLSPVATVPWF